MYIPRIKLPIRTARKKSLKDSPVPRAPPVHMLAEKKVSPNITKVKDTMPFLAVLGTGPKLKSLSCDMLDPRRC